MLKKVNRGCLRFLFSSRINYKIEDVKNNDWRFPDVDGSRSRIKHQTDAMDHIRKIDIIYLDKDVVRCTVEL